MRRRMTGLRRWASCALIGTSALAAAPISAETVDLLVLHDSYTDQYFDGETSTAVRNWVQQVNNFYDNSNMDIELRLVGLEPNEVSEDNILGTVRSDSWVQDKRDELGADFVTQLHEDMACGVGYVAVHPAWAYNVVGPQCGPKTLAHELGHNMGLLHSRRQGDESGSRYRYGLGHGEDGAYATIMTYYWEFGVNGHAPNFSNPRITCNGLPCGIPEGQPDEADAAKAVNNVRGELANFRPTEVDGGGDDGDTSAGVEIDSLTITQGDGNSWTSVQFSRDFGSAPIVAAGPPSYNGGHPTTVRIRNVTAEGFEIQLDEWDYLDDYHTSETLSYMAVEPGTQDWNGTTVTAGRIQGLNHQWQSVSHTQPFGQAPVVLAQQVSNNDRQATNTRLRNVGPGGFQIRLQEEEGNDGPHFNEDVHYIAIESGSTSVGDYRLEAANTGRAVGDDWYGVSFGEAFSEPRFLANMQTFYGNNAAAMRHQDLSAYGVQVKVEEERSRDDEVRHIPEETGWVVVSQSETSDGTDESLEDGTYLIKPRHTGQCVDVTGASRSAGTDLIQWSCHQGGNQRWAFEQQDNGYYEVRAQHSGLCMSVPDGRTGSGVLTQESCDNQANQQWDVAANDDGSYHLIARHSNLALSVLNGSTNNGARIQQRNLNDSQDQQLTLERLGN